MNDLLEIRKAIVVAIASNEELFRRLVLKGGNALDLIYLAGGRGSLDIDYSIDGDFEDPADIGEMLRHALTSHFASRDLTVFDFRFAPRPPGSPDRTWGGALRPRDLPS